MPRMDPRKQFAENLRRAREARNISQESLADSSGLHWTEISRLERGIREPKLTTIVRLARGLGIPAARLLDDIS